MGIFFLVTAIIPSPLTPKLSLHATHYTHQLSYAQPLHLTLHTHSLRSPPTPISVSGSLPNATFEYSILTTNSHVLQILNTVMDK